jgi:hypothetical protein
MSVTVQIEVGEIRNGFGRAATRSSSARSKSESVCPAPAARTLSLRCNASGTFLI